MDGEQPSLAQASENASAHLNALQAEAQSAPGAAPQAPAPEPQAQVEAASAERSWEFDHDGQRHKLSQAETDYLLRFGMSAYRQALSAQEAARSQPPQQAEPAKDPMAEISKRIESLETQLSQATTERQVERITAQLENAVAKQEIYKGFKDPKHQALFKSLTMIEQYGDKNLSPEGAAAAAAEKLSSLLKAERAAYVQGKVEQASKRVEQGGTVAATHQGPLGAKDLNNGKVLQSAMNRLKQMVGLNG